MAAKKKLDIKKAIKRPGQLHKDLKVSAKKTIPKAKVQAAAKKGGKVGARARFALVLAKMRAKKKAGK